MTDMWATSTVFLNEVKFNWKINNFSLMLNPPGNIPAFYTYCGDRTIFGEVASPAIKIGDDNCWLYIKVIKIDGDLTINGIRLKPEDYHIAVIEVKSSKNNLITGGTLTIDIAGCKVSGVMGHATRTSVQKDAIFKNQTPNIEFQGADGKFFCISRHATQIEVTVKIYFRSPITNTVGNVSVTDKGAGFAKLSADMRALLDRSAESSDFSIECGEKTFSCHELILRARSTVLDAMFQNEMTETSKRSMTVVDVGPNTMAGVLEYMYTGVITVEVENMSELIYIADKYDMEGLVEMCFKKLPEVSDEMIGEFLFVADKHNFVEFKKAIMRRIIMNKSKFVDNHDFMEKIQKVPKLLVELFKL